MLCGELRSLSGARRDPAKMKSTTVFSAGNEGGSSGSVAIVFSGLILFKGEQVFGCRANKRRH